VPRAGLEPARNKLPRDFKSLASTNFATWAKILSCQTMHAITTLQARLRSESNRRKRLCRPLHDHSATQPHQNKVRQYILSQTPTHLNGTWSGKRDSNSRPQPWQGCALPLSYSRTPQRLVPFSCQCQV
jgi:hypothetical protein